MKAQVFHYLQQVFSEEGGHCIWYGQCYKDLHDKNCPYDGPAKPLDSEGQKLLAKNCPYLLVDNGKGINTCCDTKQLTTLDQNLKLASNFLKRCPSCLDNLSRHICDFMCGTNQSNFINVTMIKEANGNILFHFITLVKFLIFYD